MPLFLLPIVTMAFFGLVWINIRNEKFTNAKSIIHLALLTNLATLAVGFALQARVPMGGFLEVFGETSLILAVIYAFFIPMDLKKLSLTLISACIVLTILSFLGGLKMSPYLYTHLSWWQQFSVQYHILMGGLLLFSLICLGTLIFGKNNENADEVAGMARTGVLTAVFIFILGQVADMMWAFSATGQLIAWNYAFMLKFFLFMIMLLPVISRPQWFKQKRSKLLFDAMTIFLVFLVNLAEWGGVF